ncbi:MAG: hypothetical protein M3P52_09060, partial [Actinomycetota bacterium]|nr:hypothetical protein [Actinomycetota bacterium]
MNTATTVDRARVWMRRNLLRTWSDAIVTVVFGGAAIYIAYRVLRYVLITGRWAIVRVNLKLLIVGRFPDDELWKVAAALAALTLWGGMLAGLVLARQRRAGTYVEHRVPLLRRARELVGRSWPALVTVAVLLALSTAVGPWITVAVAIVAGILGRLVGIAIGSTMPAWPTAGKALLVLALAATPIALTVMLTSVLGWDEWGGLMINVFIAAAAIVLCFPLGVLLALGRRSRLPLLKAMCTAYIEVFRGS